VDWLSANGVLFVDCGMGLNRSTVGLSGFARITGVDRKAFEENVSTVRLPVEHAKDDEYRRHGQITELNALNARSGSNSVSACSTAKTQRRRIFLILRRSKSIEKDGCRF
jgi:hypothetical protein